MPRSDYERKRDFRKTPEPSGRRRGKGAGDRFVIQRHRASSDHYDLRLEAAGALKSWAVPKGPSTDPRQKRLAMPTEDHPLDYLDFEGVIPADEYGAGPVIVWDAGRYENLTRDDDDREVAVDDALAAGHLRFRVEGEKLSGGYALTRIGSGERERWLLVKERDDGADARRNPTSSEPRSVRSGRTLEQVEAEEGEKTDKRPSDVVRERP